MTGLSLQRGSTAIQQRIADQCLGRSVQRQRAKMYPGDDLWCEY